VRYTSPLDPGLRKLLVKLERKNSAN
jgi:hypothetical protein